MSGPILGPLAINATAPVETPVAGLNSPGLTIFSSIIGWAYVIAWSASFYPQVWLNFRRKSVVGLSFDYIALNIVGFVFYSIYNCALYWNNTVQSQYLADYGPPLPVQLNDVIFALHAVAITLVVIGQIFFFERGDQSIFIGVKGILVLIGIATVIQLVLALVGVESWLIYIYYFSYTKLGITLTKYIPQAVLNFRRKSTVGWSIGNILLDLTGGLLSFFQQFIDALNSGNWGVMIGSPVKFILGLISIAFDILFIIQHYCLYPENGKISAGPNAQGTDPQAKQSYQKLKDDEIAPDIEQSIDTNKYD